MIENWFRAISGNSGFTVPVGDPVITVNSVTTLEATDGTSGDDDGWNGRCSILRRSDGVILRTWREGKSHNDGIGGVVHIKFSDDDGVTWSAADTYLNGTPVTGFPMTPPNTINNLYDPVHGLLILCPNEDILCQMWKGDYQTPSFDGPWQSRSTDGGLTWDTPVKKVVNNITLSQYTDQSRLFFGEDHFVYGGKIYASVRNYLYTNPGTEEQYMTVSNDNGNTWNCISQMTNTSVPPSGTGEIGYTYVGNNHITGLCRLASNNGIYKIDSYDMGLTWVKTNYASVLPISLGRTLIKSRAQLQGKAHWWNDPVLIACGYESTDPGESHPRRNCVFVSKDYGAVWSGPFYVDTEGYDGGYGDFFYNHALNQYVYCSYKSPTGLHDASTIQYNFTLTFE